MLAPLVAAAGPNAQDPTGKACLHILAGQRWSLRETYQTDLLEYTGRAVKLLLRYGARTDLLDGRGRKVSDVARKRLLTHGAQTLEILGRHNDAKVDRCIDSLCLQLYH